VIPGSEAKIISVATKTPAVSKAIFLLIFIPPSRLRTVLPLYQTVAVVFTSFLPIASSRLRVACWVYL
jgi:hypothetical protein